jgi:hypothetical protein
VLIEPLLVTKEEVLFREMVCSFAYQRIANLHIIQDIKIPQLINFIEEKYNIIEEFSEEESSIEKYSNAYEGFKKSSRYFTMPFFFLGASLLLIMAFNQFWVFALMLGLLNALTFVLIIGVVFLYLKKLKENAEIAKHFRLPRYLKKPKIDKKDLEILDEDLDHSFMAQFMFELYGRNKYARVSPIREPEPETFEEEEPETFEEEDVFEDNDDIPLFKKKELNDNLKKTYAKFMED